MELLELESFMPGLLMHVQGYDFMTWSLPIGP